MDDEGRTRCFGKLTAAATDNALLRCKRYFYRVPAKDHAKVLAAQSWK
jgi:hypothetical protein